MSCNTCGKAFSLFRQEKGCPSCGYSYCSKCLNFKLFVGKINTEASVCVKCKNNKLKAPITVVEPPDAYYQLKNRADSLGNGQNNSSVDQQIADRLNKLKKESTSDMSDDISKRLQNLKDVTSVSDAELQGRLATLRGVPVSIMQKSTLPTPEKRTEEEQVDDLLRRFAEQSQIDSNYKDDFDQVVHNIESRFKNLRGESSKSGNIKEAAVSHEQQSSDDEEEAVSKIVEKIKQESLFEDDSFPPESNELPFCEICNEDAKMRCLGCHYLFCKRCFHEHKDDDDGCDKYELYSPKNNDMKQMC